MIFSNLFLFSLLAVDTVVLARKKCNAKKHHDIHYEKMDTVPCNRLPGDYAPRTTIAAAFKTSDNTKKVIADVKINTKRASLSIENFPQIKTVECSIGKVKVTFDNAEHATAALAAWANQKDLAIIFGHERNCNGNNALATRDTTILEHDQVIDDYILDISQKSFQQIQKRGFTEFNIDNTLPSYPLDLNYNSKTNKIINPSLSLFQNPFVSTTCTNCHTKGNANIRVIIRASLIKIKTYSLHFYGHLNANIDLDLDLSKRNDNLFTKELLNVPLTPITVPGFFVFGPEFNLNVAIFFQTQTPINVTFGYTLNFPINITVSSKPGTIQPELHSDLNPSVIEHSITRSKDIVVKLGVQLIPSFDLTFDLVGIKKFNLGIAIPNEVGFKFGMDQNAACDKNEMDVSLYRRHEIVFHMVGRDNVVLYDSGDISIICFFCDKCFPRQPQSEVTTISTTTASHLATTTSVQTTTTSQQATITSEQATTTTSLIASATLATTYVNTLSTTVERLNSHTASATSTTHTASSVLVTSTTIPSSSIQTTLTEQQSTTSVRNTVSPKPTTTHDSTLFSTSIHTIHATKITTTTNVDVLPTVAGGYGRPAQAYQAKS
ncbi:hypothetical protein HDV02_005475 [Globomyces sp. JEL0801]|nr:hypothetical protein HDV02_005475 [Globomyces sp. JEL0801]